LPSPNEKVPQTYKTENMRQSFRASWKGFGIIVGGLVPALASHCAVAAPVASRPNIVVILADDMGYSDIGSFGGEINTPNLDNLARNGVRLTQFYNTARCWPTRARPLTGCNLT
jgi:hypothetical protein